MNIVLAVCLMAVTASGSEGPQRDYMSDAWFVAEFRRAALESAQRKAQELKPPRLATGGTFTGYFIWDTAFCCRWAALTKPGEFPAAYSLDCLYGFAGPDGYICREHTADGKPMISADHPISFGPPILSRAELLLYRAGHTDLQRLKRVYVPLKRHHAAIQRRWRRPDGLYFSTQFGCGMDDLPRWPHGMSPDELNKGGIRVAKEMIAPGYFQVGKWFMNVVSWNRQAGWIDLTAQMALDAATLAEIGELTGAPAEEIAAFRAEREELKRLVNAKCWDEELGFYCDVTDKGTIRRRHAGAFWVLKAELATPERAARMVKVIADPKHFNTTVPVPALDKADPDFEPERSYWRGSVWPPTNLTLVDGLIAYGYRKEAEDLIRRWYNAAAELYVRTGCATWENMLPETATHPKPVNSLRDYAGWGVIPAVVLPQMISNLKGTFTHVDVDAADIPEASRFVADAFAKRVADRSRSKETNGVFRVTFRLDPSLGGENAKVTVADGAAEVVGARVRAIWYGAGKLLSAIDYRADSFSVRPQVLEVRPVKPIRIAYWARHFHNWYHEASAKELKEYAEDMMLMGMNGFKYQYAFPVINRAGTPQGEVAAYERVSRAVYDHWRAMDADFVAGGGGNQAPDDTPEKFRGEPITEWYRGNGGFNVCPAKPGALDYLLDRRQELLGGLLKDVTVGYWLHWPYDEGGCACATCRPWGGRGFVSLCERLAKFNKAHSPAAKTVLSTWTFLPEEYELLWNYLAKPESRWIDMLMIDSHGDFPKYPLEHPLPRDIPVVTFPEISMWGRYPWGGYGAIGMPRRFEDLFRQCEKLVRGFEFYSEGLSEDLNKAVVTGLYVDPSAHWQGIVRDYARYHFPGVDPEKFVRFAELLESSHCVPGNCWKLNSFVQPKAELDAYEAKTKTLAAMARELDGEILPRMKTSWRWRLLMLRAEVDEIMAAAHDYFAPGLAKPYEEIRRIYHSAGEEVFYPNGTCHVCVTPFWPTVRLKGRPGETLRFRMVYVNRKDHAVTVDPTFGHEIAGLKLRGGHLRLNGEVAWGEKVTLEPGKSDVLVGEIAMDETVWLGTLRLKFAGHSVGVNVVK